MVQLLSIQSLSLLSLLPLSLAKLIPGPEESSFCNLFGPVNRPEAANANVNLRVSDTVRYDLSPDLCPTIAGFQGLPVCTVVNVDGVTTEKQLTQNIHCSNFSWSNQSL